jgi:hypothetical protein
MKRVSYVDLLIAAAPFAIPPVAQARFMPGPELAVGEWDLSLRCDPMFYKYELFPARVGVSTESDALPETDQQNERLQTYDARLFLYENRTFSLEPEPAQQCCMAVRGKWDLLENPYCATDRFYDQLLLTSLERFQEKRTFRRKESRLIQRLQFQINCRLQGHCASGGLFREGGGKVTHGAIVRKQLPVEQGDKQSTQPAKQVSWLQRNKEAMQRRQVAASFKGRRLNVSPRMALEEEKAERIDRSYFVY